MADRETGVSAAIREGLAADDRVSAEQVELGYRLWIVARSLPRALAQLPPPARRGAAGRA
jgi:hypothetical protein